MNIIKALPSWFKARWDNGSTTRALLSIYSKEVSALHDKVISMYNNTSLDTFENIDYKLIKCITGQFKSVIVQGLLVDVCTERELIESIENGKRACYYDDVHQILYISCTDISVPVVVDNQVVDTLPHRVWNADILDEFGLIYDMPRLDDENNAKYKARLASYKRTPGNSSLHGMCSYIGHRTGMYKEVEWLDGGTTIIISGDGLSNKVYVDAVPYMPKTTCGGLVFYGTDKFSGISRTIKYFYGFNIDNLSDTQDQEKYYEDILTCAPVQWGYARWNDITFMDEKMEGEYKKICPLYDEDLSFILEGD